MFLYIPDSHSMLNVYNYSSECREQQIETPLNFLFFLNLLNEGDFLLLEMGSQKVQIRTWKMTAT